jgi:cytochrome c556
MRKLPILMFVMGMTVSAEHNEEMHAWMKTTGTAMDTIRKLEKKTGPEVVASAERVGVVYENMIAFWRQRNAADAVKWSEDGKAAAVALASAANAGDADKAAASLKSLSETCRSCHTQYREKLPDGTYRIK